MQFICLCPTYGRPSLVRNTLALFLAQQLHDEDAAHLVIFDDANQIAEQASRHNDGRLQHTWQVLNAPEWIPLPRKYNALLDRIGICLSPDAWYVVWDDDDVYLPWHLQSIRTAVENEPHARWTHPSSVWSTYCSDPLVPLAKRLHTEDTAGRFHGSAAIRGDLLAELSGWPDTMLATFDQQQLARLAQHPCADPNRWSIASYVYRWADTGKHHASGAIDDGQYRQPPIQELDEDGQPTRIELLTGWLDGSTRTILSTLGLTGQDKCVQ